MDIYASSGIHSLLRNGTVPVIGYTVAGKRYKKDGTCALQTRVVFDLEDNGHEDMFIFEDEIHMVFHSISLSTEAFVTDLYQRLIQDKTIGPERFIAEIKMEYTLKKMGF